MRSQRNEEKYLLYRKAYGNTINHFVENPSDINTLIIQRTIFYGIKTLITKPVSKDITKESIENKFKFITVINSLIGLLTPLEFMNLYPIEKDFKGHKWGMKDYFNTRDYINTLVVDEPIGDKVLEFLLEYTNQDIEVFNITSIICLSELRQLEGYPSIAEEWANDNEIKTHTLHIGSNGKEFLIDSTGKTIRTKKSKPRYLKLVK